MSAERVATTAERLKEAMKLAKKRQIDLVRDTGLDKGSISNYLSGRYEPKSDAIAKLAMTLNVSEMWLYGYDVPMIRTEAQKKNDELAKLTALLYKDPEYYDVISMFDSLSPEDRASFKNILSSLARK